MELAVSVAEVLKRNYYPLLAIVIRQTANDIVQNGQLPCFLGIYRCVIHIYLKSYLA
ncbi:hypothetical protein GCM10026983_01400 [Gracilibacillus alcaliphilus]